MNKKLFLAFVICKVCLASDYAYEDGKYELASQLYKEKWLSNKSEPAFNGYIKSLIKLGEYKQVRAEISKIEDKNDYLVYLDVYAALALNNFKQIKNYEGGLHLSELKNFINIKEGKEFDGQDDLSRLLNNKFEEENLIKNSFFKLLSLMKQDKLDAVLILLTEKKADFVKVENQLQWYCLLELRNFLKRYDHPLYFDIEQNIVNTCPHKELLERLNNSYFSDDAYGNYASGKTFEFQNIKSFDLIMKLNQKGVINQGDLKTLIKLNSFNSENFEFGNALVNKQNSAKLFHQLYLKYQKAEYLYFSFLALLETEDYWVDLLKYKDLYFKQNKILNAFIQYLDLRESNNIKNINVLKSYVEQCGSDKIKIDYAKLIYPHSPKQAISIWESISSSRSYRYKLFHYFNTRGIVIKSDTFMDDDYLVIKNLSQFRKRNYKLSGKAYKGTFLKDQNLFLESVALSRKGDFKGASELLNYPTSNSFIMGKRADFLYLRACLENDELVLDESLKIYKELMKIELDDNLIHALRYKYFTALLKKGDKKDLLNLLETEVFEKKLNKHNYYDHRLILDAYRFYEQQKYITFCSSIEKKYGIKLR